MAALWVGPLIALHLLLAMPQPVAHAQSPQQSEHVTPLPESSQARVRRDRIAAARSWRYQLRRLDVEAIAGSDADLLVIDYAPDRWDGVERPFQRADVTRMRQRPDGGRRTLLAYLSIGEAERYRTYWNNAWYEPPTRPHWLLPPNPKWDGNFPVRFWDPDWQRIVYGEPEAYLDRIVAAGFDGVYLDRADVFQELRSSYPRAESEMVRFLSRLAAHARRLEPSFLIVMQNAEELLAHAAVADALDAVAKEDLLYGVDHDEKANAPGLVSGSLTYLRRARKRGLPVLAVEYLSEPAIARAARQRLVGYGFLPLIAERSLGTLDFMPLQR
ncbi:MAG: MJ1477/TM1410 family putative glycoside hydrolase [Hyphomicrobiaceae bacterium]